MVASYFKQSAADKRHEAGDRQLHVARPVIIGPVYVHRLYHETEIISVF